MFPNSNSFNNSNPQNNPQTSCLEKVKEIWSTVPLFVRIIFTFTIFFYILSWIFLNFITALTNIPYFVLFNFQVWRLVTSTFVTISIINILFAFISWIPDAIKLENSTGTIKYMCNFFINSFLIQILYIFLCLIFSLFSKTFLLLPSSGLWPLIMAEITILCLTNPQNQLMMMFLPCMIPAKYYPWALFAFFTILNMNLQFDILAGIIYGYLFHHFLRNKLQFSDEFIIRLENMPILNHLSKFTNFISLSTAISVSGGNQIYSNQGVNRPNPVSNNSTSQTQSRPQVPVTTKFQGKGTVLGSKKNFIF